MSQLDADHCYIFTDTETTGLDLNFSQIIQVGSLLTDENIDLCSSQDISCRLLPWIVPNPKAFLVHKRIQSLREEEITHYEMLVNVQNKWLSWSQEKNPVYITYNGHRFDEELFRRQFYWCLLPSYITNTNGASRLDLLFTFQIIANFFPERMPIPSNEDGEISLKLTDWANANNISSVDAHDALADCHLMTELTKIVKDNIKEAWDASLKGSSKHGNLALIQSEPFAMLGEVVRKQKFSYPIAYCGQNLKLTNEVAVLDLYYDPDILNEMTDSELLENIGINGTAIRKVKINRSLPLISSNKVEKLESFLDIEIKELERRSKNIRENIQLQQRISELITNNMREYPEPEFLEQSVYSGFPSEADKLWMERFKASKWEEKAMLVEGFEDIRYRKLANRLIGVNSPNQLSEDNLEKFNLFIKKRLLDKGPWLNVEKALNQTNKLVNEVNKQDKQVLKDLTNYLNSLVN